MMPRRDINPFLSNLRHGNLITPQMLLVTWVFLTEYQIFSLQPYCPTQAPESEGMTQYESQRPDFFYDYYENQLSFTLILQFIALPFASLLEKAFFLRGKVT